MTKAEWLEQMDVQRNGVVTALGAVFTHLDLLAKVLPGMSQEEAEELYAISAVKIQRMYRKIASYGNEPEEPVATLNIQ